MADTHFDPETGEILTNKPNLSELSVSELAFALKRTLEDRFGHVRVRGEISGYRGPHSSGHCYFSIKDEGAKLDAVIWRGSFGRLRAKLQEGLEVIATGKITSYPQKSGYQIIIEAIEPAGVGALMALLEERKKLLTAEGLFDAARKKPIPFLPRVIGVVTSPTGAVIRDILHRLSDRFPRRVLVWPVRVQGETSAAEVAAAIAGFNAMGVDGPMPRPDVIIVARGGGSLEDLWGFNEEIVVRAAAASAIPLISAVGHETDTTLIDFAADLRCPTPTAAAERAVPVRSELLANLSTLSGRHLRAMARVVSDRRNRLRTAGLSLPRPDDVLALARQRLDAAGGRLVQALRANSHAHRLGLERLKGRISAAPIQRRLEDQRRRLDDQALRAPRAIHRLLDRRRTDLTAQTRLFESLSYKSVLKRGYAIIRDKSDKLVPAAAATRPGQSVAIEFHDGKRDAKIEGGEKMPPRQGSLF
ncbi:MAG: exodeoxyribonuclease VII large subunit [Rhizobiales bacterium]|nr:exodeoxyribonuclease VII large subunit [Hyphomicrobiales bacterium]